MRFAVLILGFVLGAVMVTQAFVVATLSELVNDPFGADVGNVGLVMAMLWLFGVAFILGVPVVSVIAFGAAAALGLSLGLGQSERFAELALWGILSLMLAVFSVGGLWEKLRADERDAKTRAEITAIAETLER